MAPWQRLNLNESSPDNGHDDELCNTITDRHRIRHRGVCIEQGDLNLTPIASVHGARTVHNSDSVCRRQPTSRDNERGVAVRKRNRKPGFHRRPLSGRQFNGFRRHDVRTRVARVGVLRNRG